jgi:outer membrane phospholipase A
LIEDCGNKTLKDNPTIADHIGSHFNLAFQYAVQLEQENAQLKNQIQFAWNDKQTLINALEQIKTLKTELATLKQPKTKPEQLPVYDAEWLANVVSNYNNYRLDTETFRVGVTDYLGNEYPTLSDKDSAPIIMAALAKELNPLFEDDKDGYICGLFYDNTISTDDDKYQVSRYTKAHITNCSIFSSKQATQKAIDILNSINPQVLKNYFQL